MQEHKKSLSDLAIKPNWTLFLDRDGVLNKRIIDGYVLSIDAFEILPGVLEAIRMLRPLFHRVVIVTNQQCIGKKMLSLEGLEAIHQYFSDQVQKSGAHIDQFYTAPHLKSENSPMRKPGIGMALKAQQDFPSIDFQTSIMVGDMPSDMAFGKAVGMTTVLIGQQHLESNDFLFPSLLEFANHLVDPLI